MDTFCCPPRPANTVYRPPAAPLGRGPAVRRALLIVLLTAPIGASPAEMTYRWEGTATISVSTNTRKELKAGGALDQGSGWSGGDRIDRQVHIVARESRLRDINDASGRLIGRIVWLEDAGSTWTGHYSRDEALDDIKWHADQSGSGTVQLLGVMYHSLVSPNPIESSMPDGFYCLWVFLPPGVKYRLVVTEPPGADGKRDPRTNRVTDEIDDYDGLTVGDGILAGRLGTFTPYTDAALIAAMAKPAAGNEVSEGRSRVLDNGTMTGSFRHVTGGQVNAASWNLRRRLNIHGSVTAAESTWRPTLLGQTSVTASIDDAYGVTGKFRFTLFDVSREPGQALNWGTGTDLDLKFADTQPVPMTTPTRTADGWTIETTASAKSATVTMTALDYGAWGRLKAEINVDGEWYECLAPDGKASITLPLDTDGNHLADSWEEIYGISGQKATDDKDDQPAPTNAADHDRRAGDGLTNYEEYRGFVEGGRWDIGYPGQKDLFVHDALGLGVGVVSATGLRVHLIQDDEYDGGRVVNFNRGYGTNGPQKGLHVMDRALGADIAGQVFPTVGTPNTVEWVGIDTSKDTFLGVGRYFDSLIAHELGHAINMPHHGDPPRASTVCTENPLFVASRGGPYSGVWSCVMRYNDALTYEGWDGKCYAAPIQGVTSTYCRSKLGTDLNAGANRMENAVALPMAGDATVGACLDHLMIRGNAMNGR